MIRETLDAWLSTSKEEGADDRLLRLLGALYWAGASQAFHCVMGAFELPKEEGAEVVRLLQNEIVRAENLMAAAGMQAMARAAEPEVETFRGMHDTDDPPKRHLTIVPQPKREM